MYAKGIKTMLKLLLLLSLVASTYASSLKKANRHYKNNNTNKAIEYYKKACDEGVQKGCDRYDELQSPIAKAFRLISQSRGEEALVYLKQACEEGFTRGCTIYESSTGESIRPPKKLIYFQKIVSYMIEEKNKTKEEAISIALRYIWGKPLLNNLLYSKTKQHFIADLHFQGNKKFHTKVIIVLPKEHQKDFQARFNALNPEALFDVQGNKVQLQKVYLVYKDKKYALTLTD